MTTKEEERIKEYCRRRIEELRQQIIKGESLLAIEEIRAMVKAFDQVTWEINQRSK